MKKAAVFILLLLSVISAKGQDSVIYQCVFYSVVNGDIDIMSQISAQEKCILVDEKGVKYHPTFSNLLSLDFKVPAGKKYVLRNEDNTSFNINGPYSIVEISLHDSIITDTIFTENIDLLWLSFPGIDKIDNHTWTYYSDSGSLANGYKEAYYNNGNIYFNGTFKNGQPTDTVHYYFFDGKLKSICYINPKSSIKTIEEYYYPAGWGTYKTTEIDSMAGITSQVFWLEGNRHKKIVKDKRNKIPETLFYVNNKWVKDVKVELTLIHSYHNYENELYSYSGKKIDRSYSKNGERNFWRLDPGIYYFGKISTDSYNSTYGSSVDHYSNNYYHKLYISGTDSAVIDTLFTPNINRSGELHFYNRYDYFKSSKNNLNGFQTDTFSNGNLSLNGCFRNGQPYDTLTLYYTDGALRELTCYDTLTGKLHSKKWFPDGVLNFEVNAIVSPITDSSLWRRKSKFNMHLRHIPIIDSQGYSPMFYQYEIVIYNSDGEAIYYEYEDTRNIEKVELKGNSITTKILTYDSLLYIEEAHINGTYSNREWKYLKNYDKHEEPYKEIEIKYEYGDPNFKTVIKRKTHKNVTRKYRYKDNKWTLIFKTKTRYY